MRTRRRTRRMPIVIAPLLMMVAAAGCALVTPGASRSLEADERAVWSAYIQSIRERNDDRVLVISDSTMLANSAPERSWLAVVDAPFPYKALVDVQARGRERVHLPTALDSMAGVRWLSAAERREISAGSETEKLDALWNRFGGATSISSFSRPGFNARRTYAALQTYYWCGYLCGSGGYVLFRRERGGSWVIVGHFSNVIS